MKASLFVGDRKFEYTEVEEVLPGEGQVQVKIAYCGICGTDLHIFQGGYGATAYSAAGYRT